MLSRRFIGIAGIASLCALFLSARPAVKTVCAGFLPENDMKIPVGIKSAGGITESQYNEVMDRLQAIYGPIVAAQGGRLKINRLWTNSTVNSSAQRQGNVYVLNMYGGLARHPAVTQDGETLVACHEMSHHVGGAPKIDGSWATNEGQSDYAANLKCMRRMFSDPSTANFSRMEAPDPVAQQACKQVYRSSRDAALCLRVASAGLSVTALFKALTHEAKDARFDTPDPKVVQETDDSHPGTQCRLDTYLQGALCAKPVSEGFDDSDPNPGTCTRSQGFEVGLRPLCWYKPPQSESLQMLSRAAPQVRQSLGKDAAFAALGNPALWQGL